MAQRQITLTQAQQEQENDLLFDMLQRCHKPDVQTILERGADAKALDINTGKGTLQTAIENAGSDALALPIVEMLLSAQADEILAAASVAINYGYTSVTGLLAKAIGGNRPNPALLNPPLDLPVVTIVTPAAQVVAQQQAQADLDHDLRYGAGGSDIQRMLEAYVGGARLDAADEVGDTALMNGVIAKDTYVVKLLLALGADPKPQNDASDDAKALALKNGGATSGTSSKENYDLLVAAEAGKRPNLGAVLASLNLDAALERSVLDAYAERLKADKQPDTLRSEDVAAKQVREKADTLPSIEPELVPEPVVTPEPEPQKQETLQEMQQRILKQDLTRSITPRSPLQDRLIADFDPYKGSRR